MEIANLKVYNDNMRKSLLDKAYFLSFVDSDTFIDFGCADGSLLKHIHEMFPDKKLIEHYENENAKVDDLIGDPIFIEG